MKIDLEELIPGCKNFKWKEVLELTQWGIYTFPQNDSQYENLIKVTCKLQMVRDYLEQPIYITSGLRPKKYNEAIGGAPRSAHKVGKALDFRVNKIKPDRVRAILRLVLDDFDICVEDLPGASWVHLDILEPRRNTGRFFKP